MRSYIYIYGCQGGKIMTLEQIEGNEPIHENWGLEQDDAIDEVGTPPLPSPPLLSFQMTNIEYSWHR